MANEEIIPGTKKIAALTKWFLFIASLVAALTGIGWAINKAHIYISLPQRLDTFERNQVAIKEDVKEIKDDVGVIKNSVKRLMWRRERDAR